MKISKSESRNDFSEKKDFGNRKTKPTAKREKLRQKQTRKVVKLVRQSWIAQLKIKVEEDWTLLPSETLKTQLNSKSEETVPEIEVVIGSGKTEYSVFREKEARITIRDQKHSEKTLGNHQILWLSIFCFAVKGSRAHKI